MAKSKAKMSVKVKAKTKATKINQRTKPAAKAKVKTLAKTKVKSPSASSSKAKPQSKGIASKKTSSKARTKSVAKAITSSNVKAQIKTKSKSASKPLNKTKTTTIPKVQKVTSSTHLINLTEVMTPLDDRVVVQVSEPMRKTAGGLFIPDTVTDVSGNKEGTIVAVGRGHKDKKGKLHLMDVKVGDKVLFSGYAGSRFQWKEQDLIILRENELLGILNS